MNTFLGVAFADEPLEIGLFYVVHDRYALLFAGTRAPRRFALFASEYGRACVDDMPIEVPAAICHDDFWCRSVSDCQPRDQVMGASWPDQAAFAQRCPRLLVYMQPSSGLAEAQAHTRTHTHTTYTRSGSRYATLRCMRDMVSNVRRLAQANACGTWRFAATGCASSPSGSHATVVVHSRAPGGAPHEPYKRRVVHGKLSGTQVVNEPQRYR